MKVGIIGGAMKPVTRGHWALIERASKENEKVMLFISMSDRGGDDEALIKGSDMLEVWDRFLKVSLPVNVTVEFTDKSSPIRKIYEFLGHAAESGSKDFYTVYSDPDDIAKRFDMSKQKKYFGDLVKHSQVQFLGIERAGELDVSATQMRKLLKHGMKDAFISLLPEGVNTQGIWELLLLKTFVRHS